MDTDFEDASRIQQLFTCRECGPAQIRFESKASDPTKLICSECGKKLPGTVGEARELVVPFGIRQVKKVLRR